MKKSLLGFEGTTQISTDAILHKQGWEEEGKYDRSKNTLSYVSLHWATSKNAKFTETLEILMK